MRKKKCDRCQNFMLEEQFSLSSESFEPKLISAYHCIYCGRCEYGSAAQSSETSDRLVDTYVQEDIFQHSRTRNLESEF